ncbi:prepilin-type N-terminal cleavage/methylation domain-containing protein [Bacillus lacus]|uniref:ComG operon protein 3 n=1 Tax=Metabacillus lacus TaxID=1983721 RepID=A0A7X2IZE7_9BACI|nr:competence type IV pilus major pilin ComGC [Metabacillus lacus]MRX72615.1 prepilin-type N-terminal cleavage/methylation domain-containing protein [Metabacillus lacus]
MKKQNGFTLIEMLIVLLVISVLLLITIPNITKHNSNIQNKGCEGLKNMVQGQAAAYEMEKGKSATIAELISEGYIKKEPLCPDGTAVTLDSAASSGK